MEYGHGTALVIVRSGKNVLAAVDGKEVWRAWRSGTWQTEQRQMCKAWPVGPNYAMVAGLEHGTNGFDALRVVRDAWREGDSLETLASRAAAALSPPVTSLLRDVRTVDPSEFDRRYRGQTAIQLALLGMEGSKPIVIVVEFTVDSDSDTPTPRLDLRSTRCPGDCQGPVAAFFLGMHENIDDSVGRNPRLIARLNAANIASLIELERVGHPDTVGGPVAVLRVSAAGPELLQSGACATLSEGR